MSYIALSLGSFLSNFVTFTITPWRLVVVFVAFTGVFSLLFMAALDPNPMFPDWFVIILAIVIRFTDGYWQGMHFHAPKLNETLHFCSIQ